MGNLEKTRKVLKELRGWREKEAARQGVELFRVLSNDAVNGIAETLPTTKEALLEIKGIAEKKYQTYGRDILAIVSSVANPGLFSETDVEKESPEIFDDGTGDGYRQNGEKIFTVGDYLELLNVGLRQFEAKIQGEVSSVDIRGNYLFFSMKDKGGGAMISCFMWASNYRLSGMELAEGVEIMAHGFPKIHKPSGRISFEADVVELVGEGALKKAYDELKKKFEKEGLFAESRKKPISEYPQRIGLITSSTGAVIHDFLNNIGKYGFKILFRDSRVEGALAVKELVAAVRYFKKKGDIDVLVIIRGGGSLESLQAFNNETLIREAADCLFPVMVGIGHDKDVPLLSLVADCAASTPTAVAKALNASWEQALSKVRLAEQKIFSRFETAMYEKKELLRDLSGSIEGRFRLLFERFHIAEERLRRSAISIGYALTRAKDVIGRFGKVYVEKFENGCLRAKEQMKQSEKNIVEKFENASLRAKDQLKQSERTLVINNPMRQLNLGYSIALSRGKVVRSTKDVEKGDELSIRVKDGEIITNVIK